MSNYFFKYIFFLGVFLLVFVQSLTSIVYAEGGYVWTARPSAGSRFWSSIASSADGTKLAATVSTSTTPGYIYISSDSGVTWATSTSAGLRTWTGITSSADGTKLAAVVSSSTAGYIYISTDSGLTWATSSAYARLWNSITSSADGTKLAATAGNFGAQGNIYLSTDSGLTWSTSTALTKQWAGITSSTDGTKLAAAIYGAAQTSIYTSIDSGANWVARSVGASSLKRWITSSSDGTKLALTVATGVYTSASSGATWVQRPTGGRVFWNGIISSANGNTLLAASPGYLILSVDSGATWTDQVSAGSSTWNAVTSSSDGTKLVAAEGGGMIYTALYDVNAPVISNVTTSVGTSTFQVAFDTNESATTSLTYGIGSFSQKNFDQSLSTGRTFTLQDLAPCAMYTYQLGADDLNGNATSTPVQYFNTQCPGNGVAANISTVTIPSFVGDSMTLDSVIAIAPANYAATTSQFQLSRLFASALAAPTGTAYVGDRYYLNILTAATSTLATSSLPLTVIFSYENSDISALQASSLMLYRYDGASWVKAATACTINPNSMFVSCEISNFGLLALIGNYIPAAASSVATPQGSHLSAVISVPSQSSGTVAAEAVTPTPAPTSAEAIVFTRDLTVGTVGDDVRELQKFLNNQGFAVAVSGPGSKGNESSYFGLATRAALAKFQKANTIVPAVGYFGIITRSKITMIK